MSGYVHLIWAGVCILALVAGALFERHEGASSIKAQDFQASERQSEAVASARANSEAQISEIRETYETAITNARGAVPAVPGAPAMPVRVQSPTFQTRARAVLCPPAPACRTDEAPPISGPPGASGAAESEIGAEADAQVIALQRYITEVCKPEPQ